MINYVYLKHLLWGQKLFGKFLDSNEFFRKKLDMLILQFKLVKVMLL